MLEIMHEASLMQEVLEIAVREARVAGGQAISRIRLRVGALAGVVPEALQFAFDALVPGTLAEGARLEIDRAPARCRCRDCRHFFEPAGWVFICPECQSLDAETLGGHELDLLQLEIAYNV
jgi:hydrogenase nickel incorporation protein HypA/HybF